MERGVPLLFNRLSKVTIDPGRDPRDVLRDFGAVIQTHRADPGIVAMWRAVVEAREDLGDFLDTAVHQRTRALAPIADYLVALAQDRRLSIRDPDAAAAAFSELVSGGLSQVFFQQQDFKFAAGQGIDAVQPGGNHARVVEHEHVAGPEQIGKILKLKMLQAMLGAMNDQQPGLVPARGGLLRDQFGRQVKMKVGGSHGGNLPDRGENGQFTIGEGAGARNCE